MPWRETGSAFAAAVLAQQPAALPFLEARDRIPAVRGLEVHRNNYRVNLREALLLAFPVTAQLVGEEFFAAMTSIFIAAHPPRSAVLLDYGHDLPTFIDQFDPAHEVPYLSDVARLEVAWNEAYHAAEATSSTAEVLQTLEPSMVVQSVLRLHPSLRLLRSAHPVAALWAAHQPGGNSQDVCWVAEDVLVLRPDAEVTVRSLPPGYWCFLSGIAAAGSIERAATAALKECPTFDTGTALLAVIHWGAVTALTFQSGIASELS